MASKATANQQRICILIILEKNLKKVKTQLESGNLSSSEIEEFPKEFLKKLSFSLCEFSAAKGFLVLNVDVIHYVTSIISKWNILGSFAMVLMEEETALKYFQLGLEYVKKLEKLENKSYILGFFENNIGCTQVMLGNHNEALECYAKSLTHLESANEDRAFILESICQVKNNVAYALRKLEKYAEAENVLDSIVENGIKSPKHSTFHSLKQCISNLRDYETRIDEDDRPRFDMDSFSALLDLRSKALTNDDDVFQKDRQSICMASLTKCIITVNRARNNISLGNYFKAIEVLEEIKQRYKPFLLTSHVMPLIIDSIHIEALAKMGYTAKVNEILQSGYLNEILLLMKRLDELEFRPPCLLCTSDVALSLCCIGERRIAEELLNKVLMVCKALYGKDHMLTQRLVDTHEGLYSTELNELQEFVSFEEVGVSPLKHILRFYKSCSKGSPNLDGVDAKEAFKTIMEASVNEPHDYVKKAICTNMFMIAQGDLPSEEENMIIKYWYETGVEITEVQPQPFYVIYYIASLSLLLEGLLIIESLTAVIPVCEALMKAVAFAKNLDLYKDSPHFELYKSFDGLLSSFVSTTEVVVACKPINVCTIVISGRQPSTCNQSTTKKPMFKGNSLDGEANNIIVALRCTELKDVQELRAIHESNVKSVHLLEGPRLRTLIEAVLFPEAPSSVCSLRNTPWSEIFHLLLRILSECGYQTENESESPACPRVSIPFYLHEYEKRLSFATKTEPALLSAALHHSFKVQVLAEEVYKSGNDNIRIFSFTNRKHGLLKLVSQDTRLGLILSTLRPSPSDDDVIPNDVTDICDDVITKCSDVFQVRPESQTPWIRVTGGKEDFVNQDSLRNSSEVDLHENAKFRRENAYTTYLENKVQDLTRLCEEQQDYAPQLELPATPSVDVTPLITAEDEHDGPSHDVTVNETDLSLCSDDNEQTRSLSLEHDDFNQDNKLYLRQIGEAEFRRESAERLFYKAVGVQHEVQSFKRRNSYQNLHSAPGSSGVQGATNAFEASMSSKDSGVTLSSKDSYVSSTKLGIDKDKQQFDDVSHFDSNFENLHGGDQTWTQPNSTTSNEREHSDSDQSCISRNQRTRSVAEDHGMETLVEGNEESITFSEESSKESNTSANKSCSSKDLTASNKQPGISYDDSAIVERGALFEVTEDHKHDDSDSSLASFQSAKEDFTGEFDDTKEPRNGGHPSMESTSNEIDNELQHDSKETDPLQLSTKTATDLGKDSYSGGSLESNIPSREADLPSSITFTKATEQGKRTSHNEARCSSVEQKRTGSGKFRNFGTIVVDGPSSTCRNHDNAFLPEMVVPDGTSISGCKSLKSQREDSFHGVDRSLSLETEYVGICSTGSQDEQLKKSDSIVSDGCSVQNAKEVSQISIKPLRNEFKVLDIENEEISVHQGPIASNSQDETIHQLKIQPVTTRVLMLEETGCGKTSLIQTLSQLDRQTSEMSPTLQEEQNDPDDSNSKLILIIGRPGIGKTLFCQKLVRDMTQGHLPYSSLSSTVQYAFLLPFRQLNIFGKKNCTLRELVNHFSLPGNNPVIDKACFEQILKQPEQIMLVFDGYDEYLYREDILDNNFEQQYTNDPRIDMPAPVIISKVLRQNILNGARVVITSRPDQGKELRRINIDKPKEISGLSYSEMKNFIEESFKPKPRNQITSFIPGNEGELGLPGSLSSLPAQQRYTNPDYHEMHELPLPYHYEQRILENNEGTRRQRPVNTVMREGSDRGYSRLGEYYSTSLSDARDDIPNASSETRTFGLSPSFLAKHSSDYSLQYRRRLPSPFMSMPVIDGPRRERTNITQFKEFQRTEQVQTFPTSLTVFQDHCDGPQMQVRNMLSSLPPKNDVEAFVTEENNQSSKTLSTLGSESPLSDLKGADVEECQNKSSLHIAKDIRDKQSAMHSAINLATTFQSCEQYEEAILYGKKCLQISKELIDKHMEMRALLNIATTYQNLQQYEDAIALNIQCQELSQEMGDTQMEARATMNLSIIYQETRRFDEAVELSKKCIQLSRQISDKSMEMKAARVIGIIFQTTDNHHDAIHYYRMCLEIACETADKEMEMQVSRNLAVIHQSLNEVHEAIAYNKRSFDISKEVGDKDIELSTAKDLASSYLSLDQYNDAVAYNQRCLQIAREQGDKQMQIEIAEDLVKAYKVLGESENAIFYYKILFQIAKDKDDKQMEMQTTREIAILYQSMNQREVDAVVNNERCLKIAVELGDKKMEMNVTNDLATICKRMDQFGHAIAHCKRCFDIANQLGDKNMAMSRAADLGEFYKDSDQLDDAIVYYERALAIAKEIGHRELELQVIREMAAIYKALNRLDDALIYFQKSIEIAEEIGDTETEIQAIRKFRELEVQAIMEMAAIYKALNRLDDALIYFQKSIEIAEEIGDVKTEMTTRRKMATILMAQDQITQAFDYYERSLKISKESGEKRMEMEISQELAGFNKNMKKFEDAISYYERSLKIAKELSDERGCEMNVYINLATLHKALDHSDKAIECTKACRYLARLLKDRNVEIKACLFLIGLYGSQGKYDEVFLYGQRCLKIAKNCFENCTENCSGNCIENCTENCPENCPENCHRKAEVVICLAVGEAFHSMEQISMSPQWQGTVKKIDECVKSIREAMMPENLKRTSDPSKNSTNVDASSERSDHSQDETESATCSGAHHDKSAVTTSNLSKGIVEVVMDMEIPTTLNDAFDYLTNNQSITSKEELCIVQAREIWKTFTRFADRSHEHDAPQAQRSNENRAQGSGKVDSTAKTSSRAHSPGSKKSNKRSKTNTKRSFDKSSRCDGTTKVDNQGTPGDDFGSVSKACTLDGNLPCIDSSLDSNTEAVNTSNTSSGNHSLSTSCTESLSGRVNDNITSSGNPSLSTSCTESLSGRTSDNISSCEDDNQSSNNSSLPVCHVVSSNSELSDPASDCALRSLEESVSIVRETMGSLMSRSVYDMDHQLRENIRRERELRRRREQEVIDRLLANKKQKELETHHSGLQPASLPVQIADDDLASCTHFKRGCDIFFPCCNAFYQCHRCHNQSDACEVTNSKAADATHLRCRTCMTVQEITLNGSHCTFCKRKLSEYFCGKCKHFTADDKQPYHCEPCGICRIHKDNSFHCEVCNVCLNKRLKGRHKCRPNSGHDECCICLEDAFSGCQVLPCSHKVHRECAVQMIRNGVRTCPICRAPIYES